MYLTKDTKNLLTDMDSILNPLTNDQIKDLIDTNILSYSLESDVKCNDDIWNDSGVITWFNKDDSFCLKGSISMATKIFKNPTTNIDTLKNRQNTIKLFKQNLDNIKEYESDVYWLLSLPSLKEASALHIIYPQSMLLKYFNYFSLTMIYYHLYRGYISPCMNIITPLSTVFGPYFYLRKYLKWNLSIKSYLNMFLFAAKQLLKPTGNIKSDLTRYITLFLYVAMFLIGTIQSFEIASGVRKMQRNLKNKLKSISKFVATSVDEINKYPVEIWKSFGLSSEPFKYISSSIYQNLSTLYHWITNDNYKNELREMMRKIYIIDICSAINNKIISNNGCYPEYIDNNLNNSESKNKTGSTYISNMGHICLDKSQVRNPIRLNKNLIITGPNAGGKTTYVKSFCSNLLLSQTFGIAIGSKAVIKPIHTLCSFMRISDDLGSASLFESEALRCRQLIESAENVVKNGKSAIIFMDEPMHSTPPTEGAATCLAVAEYIGHLPNVRLLMTTHYHSVIELERKYPKLFINISMEAIPILQEDNNHLYKFNFPYKIKKGASVQCIALELLEEKYLPLQVIQCAIEWKNKICGKQIAKE